MLNDGGHMAATAATHPVRRIFGPPGTGKTTTLSGLIVDACRVFGGLVAVTSFTRTAALELRGRDLSLDESRVGTLHSFAYRALGAPEILERSKKLEEWNRRAPQGWVISSRSGALDDMAPGDGSDFDLYCRLRHLMLPETDRRWRSISDSAVLAFEAWKAEAEVVDFTDLIAVCLRDRVPPPVDAAVWFHDETQDSTPLELALLHQWAASCPGGLTLAGDDQQALYGFRGATPEAFLAGDAHEEVLGQSYRLPEVIRSFAHRYGHGMRHRPKEWRGLDKEGSVEHSDCRLNRPEMIVDVIERELEGGAENVMVLATCSYMLRPLLTLLRETGHSYYNPYRPERGDWNPLSRGMAQRITSYLMPEPTWWHAWRWIELLDARKARLNPGTKEGIKDELKDKDFRASRFDAWDWQAIAGEHLPPPGDLDWLCAHVLQSHRTSMDYPMEVLRRSGPEALKATPRVLIGTVHSVKGGEADTVILCPNLSRQAWEQEREDPDDVRRTMYVGMTRARRKLVLAHRGNARYFAQW